MGYLVQEYCGGGGEAEPGTGEEGRADRQAVQEVIHTVGKQVEVSQYLLVAGLSQARVGLGVTELQHFLQEEEGEDPTEYSRPDPVVAILLITVNHLENNLLKSLSSGQDVLRVGSSQGEDGGRHHLKDRRPRS